MPRKPAVSKKGEIKKNAKPKQSVKENGKESKGMSTKPFPIVGIGASAGGLEAIEGFLKQLPSGSNMAFVIIQHLDPRHKSIMADILEKYTNLKISEIENGMTVKAGHIYLNPPGKYVELLNGKLLLIDRPETYGCDLPIDHFLHCLAAEQGEKGICIILSGTGTDGTLGLRAVKAGGGMAIAQDEDQAKYNGMPKSAIDTGLVDYVLPVENMAEELLGYVKHPYLRESVGTEGELTGNLPKIFTLVRGKTGHDFSNYKRNTIRRRIERRMAVHHMDLIGDYLKYLRQNDDEVEILFKEFLITVTNFFRDAEAFDFLQENIIPSMLAERPADAQIRIWVPGCATGEEAYSLAIILSEKMQEMKKHFDVHIFATDIDFAAIEYARAGIYPETIAASVSEERLNRFFTREGNTFRVKKQIREMIIFALQNVIKDAPFSKLDMVSCRNLLIYLNPLLQKKILPLFHYTLYPDGILFLGSSESVGDFADLFSPLNAKWKIFKRKGIMPKKLTDYSVLPQFEDTGGEGAGAYKKGLKNFNLRAITEKVLVEEYSPPSVLINKKGEILYFHGRTEKFLSPPQGEATFNLLQMAHEDLTYKISTALRQAGIEKREVATEIIMSAGKEKEIINLIVRPSVGPGEAEELSLVIFESKGVYPKEAAKKKMTTKGEEMRVIALEQELHSTKEYLQTTIEELQTSNEELKSANEELQSTNEELQSTNEELETSKEELQSTNEELSTVNSELQSKVDALSLANNDLKNFLASTDIATIFLDSSLKINRFTPAMKNIFNLIPSDTGRPLGHITTTIKYEGLCKEVERVLKTRVPKEEYVVTEEGKYYLMRIMPYMTVENILDGAVITFHDVTKLKKGEAQLKEALSYAQSLVNMVKEPLVILDGKLRVRSANERFYEFFKVKQEETEGKPVYELGSNQWDIEALRRLLEEIIPKENTFEGFEVEYDFPTIGKKKMLLNAKQIKGSDAHPDLIFLAMEDVTG